MQMKDSEAGAKEKQAEEVERELEERPLAKAQKSLDSEVEISPNPIITTSEDKKDASPAPVSLEHRIKRAILNNDDNELVRVKDILSEVHRKFYEMHDARSKERSRPIPDASVCIPRFFLP